MVYNGTTSASSSFISGLSKQTIEALQQVNVKNTVVNVQSGAL